MIGTPEKANNFWLTMRERRESINKLKEVVNTSGTAAHAQALQIEQKAYKDMVREYLQ